MSKLNQIIAVASGKKTQVEKTLTEVYHKIQKPELFSGISRHYQPISDDGETLPPEEKFPQVNVKSAIDTAKLAISDLVDIIATQDTANTLARADVLIDDKVVLKDVPVTHLLFLEKQVKDIQTFIGKLPTLDSSERWEFDDQTSMYRTPVVQTNRNVKQLRNHVKAVATDKHPAQVDVYQEEVKVGTWNTTKFSTCISSKDKNDFLNRTTKLIEAIKIAREVANSIDVKKVEYGDSLVEFIFN